MARSLKYVKTTYTCNVLSCMCLMLNLNNPHSVENWPSGKLPFECQKIAKNLTFCEKMLKIKIFSKKLPLAICFEKNEKLFQFFWKNCQALGNFLTVKLQFSGGSGEEWKMTKS